MATESSQTQGGSSAEDPRSNPVRQQNIFDRLGRWLLSRKLAIVGVGVISVLVFTVLIVQFRTASYQLLYANLAPNDVVSVVTWLKGQKIDYQLKNNDRNIWVPAEQLHETRLNLAAIGLPSQSSVGFEVFDRQSFALTDFVQKINYTRALQGELGRTITALDPVKSARVHLALPEKRLLEEQQQDATASVIVTLVAGRSLDQDQVKGVIHLVAGSITGLNADHVTVIDSGGNVLNHGLGKHDDGRFSTDDLAYQQQVEQRLELRAQELLDKAVGENNSLVRITATLDFARTEETQERFDSEEPVIRSEQGQEERGMAVGGGGISGVASNAPVGQDQNGVFPGSISRTIKTVSRTTKSVGNVTNLSVSVLVADKLIEVTETSPESKESRSTEELDAIGDMIATAIGLQPKRGDQINIVSLPFIPAAVPPVVEFEPMPSTLLYDALPAIKIVLIAVGFILAYFFLIRPLIKKMSMQVVQHHKTVPELQREQSINQAAINKPQEVIPDSTVRLRREVMSDERLTSYIIKNWIQER
ncbi:MAG: flagellar M-ring protein FliF [Desulfobulbaceae bacterium]|uniref:Flagellar M-ring protein n=1 Tax=Candidatus Desulfatifera sulfidica TaxID=2841691 RepID=A0A8J6TCT7_9BACT|nr:flagellar M-ring protein FliF [Candidatus Desulfatifera sulfidica]